MFEGNILTEGGMEGNRNTILEAVLAKKTHDVFWKYFDLYLLLNIVLHIRLWVMEIVGN